MARKQGPGPNEGKNAGLGNIFHSLGGFIDLLSDLAEQGGEWKSSGESGDEKKGVKAVYGFSVRLGSGGGKPIVEPFGNVKREGRKAVVDETREPLVDVFDEGNHYRIVAELPGVTAEDIRYELRDDILNISAAHGEKKYRKEILLPAPVAADRIKLSYRNGVLELKAPKAKIA
jgi:HSP20 family protein